MHDAIYETLKQAARAKPGRLVHYSDIAPLAGLDMALQDDRNTMADILEEKGEKKKGTFYFFSWTNWGRIPVGPCPLSQLLPAGAERPDLYPP
mgnify:CR=1 FL=1